MPIKPNAEAFETMVANAAALSDEQKADIFSFLLGYMKYQENTAFIEAVNRAVKIV